MRWTACRVGLLLAAVLTGGCGAPSAPPPSPPAAPDEIPDLDACPAGDEPWRAALVGAEDDASLRRLLDRLPALDTACGAPWQVPWIAGRGLLSLGDPDAARKALTRALSRARSAKDLVGVARAGDDLAWLEYRTGRLAESERLYREALSAAGEADRADLHAFIRNNLVPVLLDRGQIGRAVELFARVGEELEALGLAGPARGAAYNRAVLLIQLGDAHAGQPLLEQIHRRSSEEGDVWTADASAVVLGNLHRALEEPALAESWYARVSEAEPELAARARLGLARLALARGEAPQASELARQAAALARQEDRPLARLADSYAAAALVEGGHLDEGLSLLDALTAEIGEAGQGGDAWVAWWLRGRAQLAAGRQGSARVSLGRAVAILEGQRHSLGGSSAGLRFLRERYEPWADLALSWLGEAVETTDPSRVAPVLDLLRRLRRRPSPTATAGREALAGLTKGLGPGERLVDYLLGRDQGVALVAGPEGVSVHRVGGHAAVRAAVEGFRAALERGKEQAAAEAGAELMRLLLVPLATRLGGCRRLMIVPDRELALLPFAALPPAGASTEPPLGLAMEISLLPAPYPPAEGPDTSPGPVLLAGRSDYGDDTYPDLPWAAYELSHLARLWGAQATLLADGALTRAGLEKLRLARFRTLHFATHAEASSRNPRRCGIVLGPGERLGLEQIAALPLSGALVILSACRTGEGEVVPGEGVIGLGRAFLDAGARGVLVSLWPVEDRSTARLMIALHGGLSRGLEPGRALLEARRKLARTDPDPAHWAPFALLEASGGSER